MSTPSPFGQKTDGLDGRTRLDSKAEARVHGHLLDLTHEGVLAGVLCHPRIAGTDGDFIVQFGPKAPAGLLHRLLLVEYDGMGIHRPRSVESKLARHAELEILGLHTRWLHDDSFAGVHAMLTDYTPPPLVTKRLVCPCGREHGAVVVFARPQDLARLQGADEFDQASPCPLCIQSDPCPPSP